MKGQHWTVWSPHGRPRLILGKAFWLSELLTFRGTKVQLPDGGPELGQWGPSGGPSNMTMESSTK